MAQANRIARQTTSWLRKRNWYQRYIANLHRHGHSSEEISLFLTGKHNLGTILDAFLWDKTPEGYEFWQKAQDEFTEWWGPCEEYFQKPCVPAN